MDRPGFRIRRLDASLRIFAASAVLWLLGWGSLDAQGNRHPDPRFVDQSIPPPHRVRLSGPLSLLPIALGQPPIATLGVMDGPEGQVFGSVTAATLVGDSLVVVVDGSANELRLFTLAGQFLGRVGREGRGPGEFKTPTALAVSPEGELWVADLQRTIQVFVPVPGGYRHERTILLPVGVRSMCFLGAELFLNGISIGDSAVIRAVDANGQIRRSFGAVYSSPNPTINYQIGGGYLACDRDAGLVIFAPANMIGEVRAYQPDGQLAWRTVVDRYQSNFVTDTRDGYRVELSPEGLHTLQALVSIPGIGLLVQWGYATLDEVRAQVPYGRIFTALLDPRTGRAALSAESWSRVTDATPSHALVVMEEDFPRILVYRLRRDR